MLTDKEKLNKMDKYLDDNVIRLEEALEEEQNPLRRELEVEKATYEHLRKEKNKWQ